MAVLHRFYCALVGQSDAYHIDIQKVIVMQHSFVEAFLFLSQNQVGQFPITCERMSREHCLSNISLFSYLISSEGPIQLLN